MKISHKFLIIFLVLTFVFTFITAMVTGVMLKDIEKNSNSAVAQIVSTVKDKYPNVSNKEIADILNNSNHSTNIKGLEKYGIDSKDWLVYSNKSQSINIVFICCVMCSLFCFLMIITFLIYSRKIKKENSEITDYLYRINKHDYSLAIESNSEDELSDLKNEIYKTTVTLREQSDLADNARNSLKDSLSDISHQLKTPLTSVIIMLDSILNDKDMPQEIREDFLQDMKKKTNQISFLVQSLLTLSKFDANSIVLKKETVQIFDILSQTEQKVAVLGEVMGVNIDISCDEKINLVCDSKWICEALTNIVKNCIEHTPEKGYVKIMAEKNSMLTKITIMDNGCGIDKNDLPHIFERFYKGKNSSDDSVGIGLAMAKTIIEKSDGCIMVSSEIDKGTTFTIKFFRNT